MIHTTSAPATAFSKEFTSNISPFVWIERYPNKIQLIGKSFIRFVIIIELQTSMDKLNNSNYKSTFNFGSIVLIIYPGRMENNNI